MRLDAHRLILVAALGLVALVWGPVSGASGQGPGVEDPYLWLEDVHGAKPLAWVKEQNAKALAALTSNPDYRRDYDAALAILDAPDRIPSAVLDHQFAFNFWQDAAHPKGIWRRTGIDEYAQAAPRWEVLLDVDALAVADKENWVWTGADCAPSLKRCLVALSRGGGDAKVVREFDLRAKAFDAGGFVLPEAKSEAAYIDDDTILFGGEPGPGALTNSGYPRVMKVWTRGQRLAEARVVAEGKTEDVGLGLVVSRTAAGNRALVNRSITFYDQQYLLVDPKGPSRELPLPLSADIKGIVHGQIIFSVRKDWSAASRQFISGSLLAFSLDEWLASGRLPAVSLLRALGPRESIGQVATGRDAVYAGVYDNVIGSIHMFTPPPDGAGSKSWKETTLDLPGKGSVEVVAANDYGSEVHVRFESFLVPTTLFAYRGTGKPKLIKSLPARFDAAGLVTEQYSATSADGTPIPYFVVRRPDTGPQPTLLYGYGGFEIPITPQYLGHMGKLWMSRGFSYAVANIRGGGEFGPRWHDAALGENRQKAFDDFAAVAADLTKRQVTTPKQLGIFGGSNGGLLVATVMTQHPELLGAVVCAVPLVDMLRYTTIGAGASWAAEYGDPVDPKMAAAIRKYSPYQNVAAGRSYPPVLFLTATSDDRVTPVHARKMAARMLAQNHDVLFYENTDGGHAAAADHRQEAEMDALSVAYLRLKLGPGHAASQR